MRAFFVAGCVLALSGLVLAQEPETIAEKPTAEQVAADKALLKQKLAELERLQAEIRELRSRLGPAGLDTKQVLISVRMLETSQKKFRAAGIELGDDGVVGLLTREASPVRRLWSAQGLNKDKCGILPTNGVAPLVKRWQERGLVTVLAEPNLVTVSGRPTQFFVGGEYPIKVAQRNGKTLLQHQKFGTQVDAAPTVLDDGRIRLDLRPSLRRIDPEKTVLINGTEVPGLSVHEVDFAVELAVGETAVVGGMTIQSDESWRKRGRDEIEFVVLATASIVEGMDPAANQRQKGDGGAPVPPGGQAGAAPAAAAPASTRR